MLDFSNTKLQLRRPLTSYPKVQALIGVVIRNRHLFANIKRPGCYLDIGCGPNIDPHFCNLDFSWRPGIDVCWDVTKGLPLPDAYVSGIFTEHMIEHVSIDATMTLLNECKRILKPG